MATPQVVAADAPNAMRAWVFPKQGEFEAMEFVHIAKPEPEEGEVRIRLAAACTNPVDYKRTGWGLFPCVMGCDGAGVVDAVGAGVTDLVLGDRVQVHCSVFLGFGTYAEYLCMKPKGVVKIPATMSFADAASIPCAAWTAYEALFAKMHIQAGKTFFVSGGAGGVSNFAIQMALATGCTVLTSASGDNVARLQEQGCHLVVDYKRDSVKEKVLEFTKGLGVDYLYETATPNNFPDDIEMLAMNGQLASIVGGIPVPPNAFLKGLSFHHGFLGGHHNVEVDDSLRTYGSNVLAFIEKGQVKTTVTKVEPLSAAKDLLVEQMTGHVRGKVVMSMTEPLHAVRDPAFTF